jgi:hypothetical protein
LARRRIYDEVNKRGGGITEADYAAMRRVNVGDPVAEEGPLAVIPPHSFSR